MTREGEKDGQSRSRMTLHVTVRTDTVSWVQQELPVPGNDGMRAEQ